MDLIVLYVCVYSYMKMRTSTGWRYQTVSRRIKVPIHVQSPTLQAHSLYLQNQTYMVSHFCYSCISGVLMKNSSNIAVILLQKLHTTSSVQFKNHIHCIRSSNLIFSLIKVAFIPGHSYHIILHLNLSSCYYQGTRLKKFMCF